MEKLKTNPEKLLLLACHPKKSYWLISRQVLNMGIAGTLMLDLVEAKAIDFDQKKVVVKSRPSGLTSAHEIVWKFINERNKSRKAKRWINALSNKASHYRKPLFRLMEQQGLLRVENHQFLFIPYLKISVSDNISRDNLIANLKKKVEGPDALTTSEASLMSVVYAIKLFKPFEKKISDRKAFKKKVKQKIAENPVAEGIQDAIQEMQAAVAAASVAAIAGSSATSGG